jgi:hypothetical protein
VLRIRWSDPQPDTGPTPGAWKKVALITATLFLNFPFWFIHGNDIFLFHSAAINAVVVAIGSVVLTALFFIGPATTSQQAKTPLLNVVEHSLGLIPAWYARLCCISFLVLWMAELAAVIASWQAQWIIGREISQIESTAVAAAILVFLFLTGLQSWRMSSKQALFTNKLAVAVLFAALIRVRSGWPAALHWLQASDHAPTLWDLCHGFSILGFYVAPLSLLATNLSSALTASKKDVMKTAVMGIALPLCGALLLVGVIDVAVFASEYYRPSLNPNIAMALWGKAARTGLRGTMMIAAITTFGAARFGARALNDVVSIPALGKRRIWLVLSVCIWASAWIAGHEWFIDPSTLFEISATSLAIVAAVLTGDFATGFRRDQRTPVDWVGSAALLAGLATFTCGWFFDPSAERWWHPWLFPSYGVAFIVCFLGRVRKVRHRPSSQGL